MNIHEISGQYDKVPELSLKSYLHGSQEDKQQFVNALTAGLKYFGFMIHW